MEEKEEAIRVIKPNLIENGTMWEMDGVIWPVIKKTNALEAAVMEMKRLQKELEMAWINQ